MTYYRLQKATGKDFENFHGNKVTSNQRNWYVCLISRCSILYSKAKTMQHAIWDTFVFPCDMKGGKTWRLLPPPFISGSFPFIK